MNLNSLLDKVNYYSAKDKRGKTFKISEFNTLLPTVQDMLYNRELDEITSGKTSLANTPLRPFKSDDSFTVDDGFYPLPEDYRRWVSVSRGYHEVDVIPEPDFNARRSSVLRRPFIRPFCYFTGTDIVTCPTNIGLTELLYFRNPLIPYFDYCQDVATLNEIFMPVGSVVKADDANTYSLYDSANNLLKSNVTVSPAAYPHTSKTVELEWEPIYHDMFVLSMLALVGINIQMNELTQYAEGKSNA